MTGSDLLILAPWLVLAAALVVVGVSCAGRADPGGNETAGAFGSMAGTK